MKPPRPSLQDIDGVILLDKPSGISSNAALQRVRRLYLAKKGGHTGSLDPLASGLLPICLGEATKFSSHLLDSNKCYEVRVRFGSETDTLDCEGNTTRRCEPPALSEENLEMTLKAFRGEIIQVPPMYSALKHQGQRLYDLARRGVEVERKGRAVTLYRLEWLQWGEGFVDLEVKCSKGTYIRSLAQDIGRHLKSAAHVEVLRRTAVAHYGVEAALTLESLEALSPEGRISALLSPDALVGHFPKVEINEAMTRLAGHGHPVESEDARDLGWVRIYGTRGFMGLGEVVAKGRIQPKRMARFSSDAGGADA